MLTGRWLLWGVWRRADPVQRDAFSLYLLWMLQAITVLAVWAHEQDQKVAFFRALALCGSLEVGSKTYFWGVVYCTWVTSYIRNPLCPDLVYVKGLVVKVIFLASNCVENYHWSNFLLVLLIIGTAALIQLWSVDRLRQACLVLPFVLRPVKMCEFTRYRIAIPPLALILLTEVALARPWLGWLQNSSMAQS